MKLKGYYMTAVAKTEMGISDIIVFDVKTRAELVKRLDEVHPTCAACTILNGICSS